MIGQSDLSSVAPEEQYIVARGAVVFGGWDGKTRVRCAISRKALDDHFQGDNRDKLEVFRANRQAIELNSAAAIS